VIDHTEFANRQQFDEAMHQLLNLHLVDVVCLAGFMRLLSPAFVTQWQDKLLNIHPSLLPAFKGTHVHEQVVAAGVRFSGCSVHFVRTEMDVGPIIVQAVVPVLAADTPQTLAARVLEQEHRCYPLALRWLAEGRLSVSGEKVLVKGAGDAQGALMQPVQA
jgi:phosphoribosylglycinamide formyltransferase-1